MNSKIRAVSFLFLTAALAGCGQATASHVFTETSSQKSKVQVEPKVATYGFVHKETTGITSYVVINGKVLPIQFRSDSDPIALDALKALNWRVYLPNTDGKKLFVVGQYFPEVKKTPACKQCAEAEEYQEFKLLDWYITTPFKVVRADCENCLYLLGKNLRTKNSLEQKDFDDFHGRDSIDVRRFQRKKSIQKRHRI